MTHTVWETPPCVGGQLSLSLTLSWEELPRQQLSLFKCQLNWGNDEIFPAVQSQSYFACFIQINQCPKSTARSEI